jgi:hypothetical protein
MPHYHEVKEAQAVWDAEFLYVFAGKYVGYLKGSNNPSIIES